MHCAQKNSYLQLELAMEPRLINKAVRRAMRKKQIDPHDELPAAQRLSSAQPSMFAPWADITRTQIGFGRVGLRILNRDLSSDDPLIQLQAIHTIFDKVKISEDAMFLINLNVVYRLIDLINNSDAIIREKVILILIRLANYYQGKIRILTRPVIVDHIIEIFLHDCKEIRYVAALLLKTLTRDRCACEIILKNDKIVETLLEVMRNDHMTIVIYYMNALKNLSVLDQVRPLKANAFQVMRHFMMVHESRIVTASMDCMMQLCKHPVGQALANRHDMVKVIKQILLASDIEIIISAVGLLHYITLTNMAKWRAKELQWDLIKRLVTLSISSNLPSLQLRALQVLINLCDCPDIREHIRFIWRDKIMSIKVKTHDQWDGTRPTTTFGLETGHNYRTMCIEDVETIRNDYGDSAEVINVHSFLRRVRDAKDRLIKAIDAKPDYPELRMPEWTANPKVFKNKRDENDGGTSPLRGPKRNERNVARNVLDMNVEVYKNRGRLRKLWMDCVKGDMARKERMKGIIYSRDKKLIVDLNSKRTETPNTMW